MKTFLEEENNTLDTHTHAHTKVLGTLAKYV